MDGEGRIPPLLVAGLVALVLAIGALAYYAGRFGRSGDGPVNDSTVELPPPAPPDPAVVLGLPTPAEVPPTVPPSVGVVIENTSRSSRVLSNAEMADFEARMAAEVKRTGRCVLARSSDGKLVYWRGGDCAFRTEAEKEKS